MAKQKYISTKDAVRLKYNSMCIHELCLRYAWSYSGVGYLLSLGEELLGLVGIV